MTELAVSRNHEEFDVCCPACDEKVASLTKSGSANGETVYLDGDAIPIRQQPGQCVSDAELLALECSGCGAHLYSVAVLVGTDPVSGQFALEEIVGDSPDELLIVHGGGDRPWYCLAYNNVDLANAIDGASIKQRRVHWHHIGPFVSAQPLNGPYGVSACADAPAWDHARRLVSDELPRLRACLNDSLATEQPEHDATHRRTTGRHPSQ